MYLFNIRLVVQISDEIRCYGSSDSLPRVVMMSSM